MVSREKTLITDSSVLLGKKPGILSKVISMNMLCLESSYALAMM